MSTTPELFILPDPNGRCPERHAVVADSELPIYEGRLRSASELHPGRWAYPFPTLESAQEGARNITEATR